MSKYKENSLHKLFFKSKPLHLILSLRDGPKYPATIAREINCTYAHLIKILNILKQHDLVEFNKVGRIKVITVTKRGEEFFKQVRSLYEKLSTI